jgi:hypothetical protein
MTLLFSLRVTPTIVESAKRLMFVEILLLTAWKNSMLLVRIPYCVTGVIILAAAHVINISSLAGVGVGLSNAFGVWILAMGEVISGVLHV